MTSDLLEENQDLRKQVEELKEENEELKINNKTLREKVHWWKKEVNVAHRARADEFENITIENKVLKSKLTKATKIIKELCGMVRELNNPNVQLTNIDYSLSEAKQFISEVEK